MSIERQLEIAHLKLLQASVDLIEKDKIIAALDKQLAACQGQLRRSTLPFKRDQVPALLRRQI